MAASNARGEKDGDQDRSRVRIDVNQLLPAMPSPPVVPSAVQPGELRCL